MPGGGGPRQILRRRGGDIQQRENWEEKGGHGVDEAEYSEGLLERTKKGELGQNIGFL